MVISKFLYKFQHTDLPFLNFKFCSFLISLVFIAVSQFSLILLSFSFAALQYPISHNDSTIFLMKVLNSQFNEFGSQPQKTADILDATTGFPAKWRLRNDRKNSILMTRHYPDLGDASDLSCRARNSLQPIRNATQIWVLTGHQYGIPALVSQTSFRGKPVLASRNFGCFLKLLGSNLVTHVD